MPFSCKKFYDVFFSKHAEGIQERNSWCNTLTWTFILHGCQQALHKVESNSSFKENSTPTMVHFLSESDGV